MSQSTSVPIIRRASAAPAGLVSISDGSRSYLLDSSLNLLATTPDVPTEVGYEGGGAISADVADPTGTDLYVVGERSLGTVGSKDIGGTLSGWGTAPTPVGFNTINYDPVGDFFIIKGSWCIDLDGGGTQKAIWCVRPDGTVVRGWVNQSTVLNMATDVKTVGWDPATRKLRFAMRISPSATNRIYEIDIDTGVVTDLMANPGVASISTRRSDGALALLRQNNTLEYYSPAGVLLGSATANLNQPADPVNDYPIYGDLSPDGSTYYLGFVDGTTWNCYLRSFDAVTGAFIADWHAPVSPPVSYSVYSVRAIG